MEFKLLLRKDPKEIKIYHNISPMSALKHFGKHFKKHHKTVLFFGLCWIYNLCQSHIKYQEKSQKIRSKCENSTWCIKSQAYKEITLT